MLDAQDAKDSSRSLSISPLVNSALRSKRQRTAIHVRGNPLVREIRVVHLSGDPQPCCWHGNKQDNQVLVPDLRSGHGRIHVIIEEILKGQVLTQHGQPKVLEPLHRHQVAEHSAEIHSVGLGSERQLRA